MTDLKKAFDHLRQYFRKVTPKQYVEDLRIANPDTVLPCDAPVKEPNQ